MDISNPYALLAILIFTAGLISGVVRYARARAQEKEAGREHQ
ncbi:hypothetical protein [Streptomyces sp. MNU76]|nr:hypothetical protein [Streptomyces sp. MNU76]